MTSLEPGRLMGVEEINTKTFRADENPGWPSTDLSTWFSHLSMHERHLKGTQDCRTSPPPTAWWVQGGAQPGDSEACDRPLSLWGLVWHMEEESSNRAGTWRAMVFGEFGLANHHHQEWSLIRVFWMTIASPLYLKIYASSYLFVVLGNPKTGSL